MADLALTLARESGAALQASTPAGFLTVTTFDQACKVAEFIAKSQLVPDAYRGKPADIVIAMQLGMELGLAPLQALQSIAVINGRPSLWGDAMKGLVIGLPECEDFIEEEPQGDDPERWVATCTIKRRNKTAVSRSFSWGDAKAAGLAGKAGPWKQYGKRMLMLRARGFALRDAFPDRLRGIITAEEAEDYPTTTVPAPLEPRRVGESSTVPPSDPAVPPAETAPSDRAAAAPATPTAPSQGTAPSPSPSPKEETAVVSVTNTACTPKNNVMRYDISTSAGMFYTRDQGLYDVIRQIEKTDHTATVTYKTVPAGDTRVNVLTSVVIDEPVQQGELLDGGAN